MKNKIWALPFVFFSETVPEQRPRKERTVNKETQQAKNELMDFLKSLKRPAAQDFVKVVQELVDKLYHNVDSPVEELTDLVQDFYIKLGKRMETHSLYKGKYSGHSSVFVEQCSINHMYRHLKCEHDMRLS